MKRNLLILSFIISFVFSFIPITTYAHIDDRNIHILYLNSYHKGYKWSDDILEGIKSQLALNHQNIELDVEYMDTRHISESEYFTALKEVYSYKFKNNRYDLIISSDDKAFHFLQQYRATLFPNTPIVFCGVNNRDIKLWQKKHLMTGIIEGFDIDGTIELALKFHPNLKNIYYINDTTITGRNVEKVLQESISRYQEQLHFVELTGDNLQAIVAKEKNIPANSILLFLIYFKDKEGTIFNYAESIEIVSKNSPVPIYGVWDFHLGHGIVGGLLTSGYTQGAAVAKIALRILAGEHPADIPVTAENTNQYKFDYTQLKKYDIKLNALPKNSFVVNHNADNKHHILILNSYHKGLQWTDDIEKGIKEVLGKEIANIDIAYEYMDLKRHSDPVALHDIRSYLKKKYIDTNFDAVIVTDDHAYQFTLDYNHQLFNKTPIIFCGLNYYDEATHQKHENMTGVVEKNHYQETLDLALQLHPNTQRVIVINDTTLTGQKNRLHMEKLLPQYKGRARFEFWSDVNMTTIQKDVSKLQRGDIIYLLSFNQDKSYNNFTYTESIQLIAEKAQVPIYGLWDFYLNHGLFGGKLTSGIVQGKHVGNIIKRILGGTTPKEIPVIQKDVGVYMFDDNLLRKYNVDHQALPAGSIVINEPFSLIDMYNNHRGVFISIVLLICAVLFLFFIIFLLLRTNRIKRLMVEQERKYASTDILTGIPNRRACFNYLNKYVVDANQKNTTFVIAFLDINRLKYVNDVYGHTEGDELIKNICHLIQEKLCDGEILCRMGGDEFLIIFHNIELEKALHTWDKIQKNIDAFNQRQNKPYITSTSIGFMEYDPQKSQTIDELIDEADKKMYKNKLSYRKKHNISDKR